MLANLLPAGERGSLIAMAQTWQRLAEEQDRATDLRHHDGCADQIGTAFLTHVGHGA